MIMSCKKHLFSALALACVTFIVSCGENANRPSKTTDNVQSSFSAAAYLAKDTIGFFRGAEFGDESEVIRQMETDSALVFSSPNILKYEYQLPGDRHYNIDYTFKKNRLSSLNFDIFLNSETEAENLTVEFKEWFSKKFGEGTSEMGFFAWKVPAENYKEAFIELKDESAEFGYGKVNITAYAIR